MGLLSEPVPHYLMSTMCDVYNAMRDNVVRAITVITLLLIVAGCAGDRSAAEAASDGVTIGSAEAEVAAWTVQSDAGLSIGVVEGDAPYQFDDIRWVSLLHDDLIGVVDGGSYEARLFGSEGDALLAVGGRGDGPGEFRSPGQILASEGGGIEVVDIATNRISHFTEDGEYAQSSDFDRPGRFFPLDQWYHRRNLVQGRIDSRRRAALNSLVDLLPEPLPQTIFRWVILSDVGHLWTTESEPGGDDSTEWQIFDMNGRPVASTWLPARFMPEQIGGSFVLGVYWDEFDVQHVRRYPIDRPGRVPDVEVDKSLDHLAVSAPTGFDQVVPDEESLSEMRGIVRNMASSQEIHYSDNFNYASSLEAMDIQLPEHLHGHLFGVGSTGWMIAVDNVEAASRCIMIVGRPLPSAPIPRGYGGQGRALCMAL